MFRQSVRQAMKAVTVELEGMQGNLVTAADTQRVAAQIGSVTQLIAEVVHKTHVVSSCLAGLLHTVSYCCGTLSMYSSDCTVLQQH